MAIGFREWPWPLQALFYVGLTVALVLAGLFIPGLPLSSARSDLQTAQNQLKPLETEVGNLRVYKQRRAELQSEMDALQKQLATLQTIVPEEKEADQFILMMQRAAVTAGVSIRSLTAKPIAQKQYYYEMPFDIEADGPYFSVLDFFARMGRLSRIINVGDLKMAAVGTSARKFHMAPGTSVTGSFTITTFFTNPTQAPAAAGSAPAAPARAPGRAPARTPAPAAEQPM
jgi:type IV pilus assembly protein PilO